VKYGADHYTNNCTKKLEEPAKCANCGENPPANYKGCQTFKKILSHIKSKTGTKKDIQTHTVPPTPHRSGHNALSSNPKGKPSYAKATANIISPFDQPL